MNILELFQNKKINKTIEEIKDSQKVLITNTTLHHNLLLISSYFNQNKKTLFYVTTNTYKASHAYEMFCHILDSNSISLYCYEDVTTLELLALSNEFRLERLKTIKNIIDNTPQIIVTHTEAITKAIVEKSIISSHIQTFKKGSIIDINELINILTFSGYTRSSTCDSLGHFSIRGGIIDIFPMFYSNPIRFEMFDDEIETIKEYDAITQKSIKIVEEVEIFPVVDFIYDDNNISNLPDEFNDDEIEAIKSRLNPERMNKYVDYLFSSHNNIIDYIDEKIVFLDDYKALKGKYQHTLIDLENIEKPHDRLVFYDDFDEVINGKYKKVYLSEFKESSEITYNALIPLHGYYSINYQNNIKDLIDDLKHLDKTAVILFFNEQQLELLTNILSDHQITYNKINSSNDIITKQINVGVSSNAISYAYDDIMVITGNEVFKNIQLKKARYQSSKYNTTVIKNKDELKQGDYVVHYDYGIGIYKGLKTMEINGIKNDYLVIQYSNVELYILVEKINLIERYAASEGTVPKLSKVGTNEWKKKKAEIKEKLERIAKELITTEAKRNSSLGFKYINDEELTKEFCSSFEFEETIDQKKAIDDITSDMTKGIIVDRLVCGDVGYGKTEIAMRASFLTVLNQKQVVYLVPTTILARQHYYTFKNRFERFGFKIAMLSRLVSVNEQKEVLKKLKEGTIDIVIGTHRLLSDEIKYNDLGLLIVDEEQRFGVLHKEKIKKLKENINVLTLTATPIPRTLQMSIMGLRQLSLIETPPKDRYPIQTYVLEHNDMVIKEAIYREISRSGQVFYLHNHITSLVKTVNKIKKLVPEAKIAMAHGKMEKEQIEDVIQSFIDQEFNVLICTTIIETGIDIPNSNTLIIDDVDRLGLSQLYQIRGRIGRSDRVAYAYLMYEQDKVLTQNASKRLKAIQEFTNLGSGYKIAMRDLAIRGAGDILGSEQSGYIDMIGIDMYMRMLEESIHELKGEKIPSNESYNIKVSKHISDNYVSDEEIKILIHERINSIKTKKEKADLIQELTDRFGKLNTDIINYIDDKYLEVFLNKFEIKEVYEDEKIASISFPVNVSNKLNAGTLFTSAYKISANLSFEYKNHQIIVTYKKNKATSKEWLNAFSSLLQSI